jgi:hypothetical protein
MRRALATTLFSLFLLGRCPAYACWSRFSIPVPAATGVPPEMQHLIPRISKCRRNGCTSSIRAIIGLELRSAAKEA